MFHTGAPYNTIDCTTPHNMSLLTQPDISRLFPLSFTHTPQNSNCHQAKYWGIWPLLEMLSWSTHAWNWPHLPSSRQTWPFWHSSNSSSRKLTHLVPRRPETWSALCSLGWIHVKDIPHQFQFHYMQRLSEYTPFWYFSRLQTRPTRCLASRTPHLLALIISCVIRVTPIINLLRPKKSGCPIHLPQS